MVKLLLKICLTLWSILLLLPGGSTLTEDQIISNYANEITSSNLSTILEYAGNRGLQFQEDAHNIIKQAFVNLDSIDQILSFIHQLAYAGNDVTVFDAVVEEMETRNFLSGPPAVLLAVRMQQTMQKPSYSTLPDWVKQRFQSIVVRLPENVQSLVAPKLLIKNSKFGQYLLTDIADPFDYKRRHIYLATVQKPTCEHYGWTVGKPDEFKSGFSLLNAWKDNLYASVHYFSAANKERRVLAWVPRQTDKDAEWTILPKGNGSHFLIKNVDRNEYLCGFGGTKGKNSRRSVGTLVTKTCCDVCEWEFESK